MAGKTEATRLLCAIAVCGLAFGVWVPGWKDEPGPRRHLAVLKQPSGSAGTGAEGDTAVPSPEGVPPASYEEVSDQEGFRLAVPRGWVRQLAEPAEGFDVVNYRSPEGDRRLQVSRVSGSSPYASLRTWLGETSMPAGFDRLAPVERTDDGGRPAARLAYVADAFKGEPDNGTWHVIDHRFEAADGELYAVAVYGPDADGRDDERELMSTALSWFCPPDETCPKP